MKTIDNLIIIPARKNSQRIKDKNLLKLGKKKPGRNYFRFCFENIG